ncbi:lysylphosphatidylglycerol synthase domain-containing protein [Humibacillus xanthopallidus]|uniref:lysylphosphatidylglycerol synthase domain-containing protein n=1 Tax=Humibacillus xanthopallidus TaxID=412689 RepID=UPI003850C679
MISTLHLVNTATLLFTTAVVVVLALARRGSALRDVVAAGALAVLGTVACMAAYGELWPIPLPEYAADPVPQFPVLRVAAVAAMLLAAAPHLARPIRRVGWVLVLLSGVAAPVLGFGEPSGSIGAVGIAMVSAGAVLLAFGSPRGYPSVASVAEALTDLGLRLTDLRVDPDQSWGVRRMVGTASDGGPVEVKAFGRDATDSQLAARAWRRLVYRGEDSTLAFSRLQSAEHEALVTLLAQRAGVTVPDVLAAASTSGEVAILATRSRGARLDAVDPDTITDPDLLGLWQDLMRLHDSGISHGALDIGAVRKDEDGLVLGEFASGSLHPGERQKRLDTARLLFVLAQLLGVDRAVTTSRTALGDDQLGATLPYLQTPAMPSRDRRHPHVTARQLKELRARVAAETGVAPTEPVKLRRVGPRDVLTLAVLMLFVGAMLPVLAGVDYAQLWAELQGAIWWVLACAVILGQVVFLPQAASMMFSVGRSLPLRPATTLQSAIAFISFAIPGVAGRVTMNAAFLHKFGVSPAVAVTQGGIDGLSGFIAQLVILVVAFATGTVVFDVSGASAAEVDWQLLLAIVLLLAVVALVALWRVRRLRDRVLPVLRSAWTALAELMRSPSRAIGLFGTQLLIQLMWGLILWASLAAVGSPLGLLSCTVVVVATSLFQGIVPIPGGIGVSEALMVGLLVPLGVSAEVAMAATVVWRVATFYLPATEGFFASRWLERHGYL